MRHGDKINALGRTKSHRDALLKNMACSLIEHKRIFTTLAKAKALRVYLEPMITRSKSNQTHDRRVVFSYLQNKYAVDTLFSEISEKVASRPGGYLRIIKTGPRKSDASEMAMIEFVDYNTIYDPNENAKKAKTTRRSRRKNKGAETTSATPATVVTETAEVPPEVTESVNEVVADVQEATETVTEPTIDLAETTTEVADEVTETVSDAVELPADEKATQEESAPEAETTDESTEDQKDA